MTFYSDTLKAPNNVHKVLGSMAHEVSLLLYNCDKFGIENFPNFIPIIPGKVGPYFSFQYRIDNNNTNL